MDQTKTTRCRAYVGIDVAIAKRKYLPVSVCIHKNGRLIPLPLRIRTVIPPKGQGNIATLKDKKIQQFAQETVTFLENVALVENLDIIRIGIDAPRDYRPENMPRRFAEEALHNEGISYFKTPSRQEFEQIKRKVRKHLDYEGSESRLPHGNQLWMLVGFALFQELSKIAECIEVYPQAIVKALKSGDIHKSKQEGFEAQITSVAQLTGWSDKNELKSYLMKSGYGKRDDKLDAYLSAWVASLDETDRIPLGMLPNDVIWIPRDQTPNRDCK